MKCILYCSCRWKWGVIIAVNFQFKILEGRSLKNMRASMGFEPLTSATPARCSTNWAMKPHIGSEVKFVEFMSSCAVKWCEIYMKCILYCGCRWKWGVIIAVNFQFKQLEASSFQLLKFEIYCDDHSSLSDSSIITKLPWWLWKVKHLLVSRYRDRQFSIL